MLYNSMKRDYRKPADCMVCPYFNTKTKKCEGFGKICFEVDRTNTAIDPVTGLAIKF